MWMQRAPARGRYDRGQSREARFREQYLRLLAATVRAASQGNETVTRVIAIAGVGRSTFHEFFDDYAHALRAARAHAVGSLRATLAANEAQRLEALLGVWLDAVRDEPELALVTLRVSGDQSISELGAVLVEALDHVVTDDSRDALTQLRLALVAAAAEGCARDLARHALTPAGAPGVEVEKVKRLLVATVQGILASTPRDKL